jgi:putative ABC transport system permease protein
MEKLFGVSMDTIMAVVLGFSLLVLVLVGLLALRRPILARLALRNVPRRPAQTVLIVFGLMLATLLITAAFGTGDTMSYSMRRAFTDYLGNTDLQVHKANPQVEVEGPPDFNRPVPAFEASVLDQLKAKAGNDDRIDGWSLRFEQTAPLIDTVSRQASGQTFIEGVDAGIVNTTGVLRNMDGQAFDIATLKTGEILIDKAAADKLDAVKGHKVQIAVAGKATDFTVRDILDYSSPSSQFPVSFIRLDQAQQIFNAPGMVTVIDVSLKGGAFEGVKYSKDVTEKLRGLLPDKSYEVEEAKQDALNIAETIGSAVTTLFVGISLFSIAAGILLIFLIFAMLAAERKSEMGMARAVGTQRGHLTQMFTFEGLAYDLAAAAVGAALGIAVGFAMVGAISQLFGTYGFALTPHIEVRSVVVAYCLGMLITFLTVAISAARVSRLNIVAAIRDIPDMPRPDKTLMQHIIEPFNQLGEGRPLGCIGGIFALVFSLLRSGPVAGTLGVLMVASGWALKNGFLFHTGASLAIIALGLTIRWLLGKSGVRPARRDRIAFTFAGVALLVYWALPIDSLQKWFGVPEFGAGIEQFFVGGIMMVAGAVWAIMYNSDILLGALTVLLGGIGRMRPVLKTAVAYPMSSIFRTGMTIAMFALIMFVLILMSVLVNINGQVDPNKPEVSGNYQIQASVSFANPVNDMSTRVESDPTLKGKFASVAGQTLIPLQMRQVGVKNPLKVNFTDEQLKANPSLAEGWRFYNARFADDEFIKSNEFKMMIRAKGYDSERAVWDAVAKDPTLVVVDSIPVLIGEVNDRTGGSSSFGGRSNLLSISGVRSDSTVMDPVELEMHVPGLPNAPTVKVKVIGVLNNFAQNYPGLYVSSKLASQVSPFPLPVSTYFLRVKPGQDPEQLRRALGSAFLSNGMEPVVIADDLRKQQAVGNGLIGLMQGFMALGLLVGVAALGVISTRAVVERRQQIGVLRAIGYQRGMVAASFLFESSFVALLGILIGVGLGLILSYNLTQYSARSTPTLHFDVPWLQIGGIVLLAYVISLISTILPARSAARIYPAEALRYE